MKNKKNKKYATTLTDEGDVYCDIAKVMTKMGYKMNHFTARNIVLSVMERVIIKVAHSHNIKINKYQKKEIAANPDFQSIIAKCFDSANDIMTHTHR